MSVFLAIFALIIFTCIFLGKVSNKLGAPVLLLFILLGMLTGVNDELGPEYRQVVQHLCSFALVFVMFYGGFGTRWSTARPVALPSAMLSTAGVLLTAAFTGLFCHFVLGWNWAESFLMGATISSTDAATVFSILRSRRLGLRNNTAPLLEMESGSNDPCSYMLTVVMLGILGGSVSAGAVVWKVFAQIVFGALAGLVISQAALFILRRYNFPGGGYASLFFLAVAVISYALPDLVGGNGYLSTYIVGIVLGNSDFEDKKNIIGFFDGITSLMQMLLFFILGYMVNHADLVRVILPSFAIFLFITIAGRPLSVFLTLAPFRRFSFRQMGLISFVGLRGAASIVFAIMTLSSAVLMENDIFDMVFVIVLLSISLQGSLIPWVSKKFGMVDEKEDVLTTFSDFSENADVSFCEVIVDSGGAWNGKYIKDIEFPGDMIAAFVVREGRNMVARGHVTLHAGDKVVLCAKSFEGGDGENIRRVSVGADSALSGKKLKDCGFDSSRLVLLVQRESGSVIPNGNTVLHPGDTLMILDNN